MHADPCDKVGFSIMQKVCKMPFFILSALDLFHK